MLQIYCGRTVAPAKDNDPVTETAADDESTLTTLLDQMATILDYRGAYQGGGGGGGITIVLTTSYYQQS